MGIKYSGNELKYKAGLALVIIAAFVLIILGNADMVSADSDNLTVQVTGTNYDPTVDTCAVASSSYDPLEASSRIVTVRFNVSDTNGVDDLNNSLAKVEFDDNATAFVSVYESATGTTCTPSDINTTTRQYECIVYMVYWYQHTRNYSIRCYGGDNNDSTLVTKDQNNAFDYTKLVASLLDGTAVSFGTITSSQYNTNKSDTNSPVYITNTGNAVLANITLQGANATTAGKPDIDVGQFWVDDDSGVSGAQQLTTSAQQITGVSVPTEDSTPGGNLDYFYIWLSVPAALEPGDYSSTWTLTEAE